LTSNQISADIDEFIYYEYKINLFRDILTKLHKTDFPNSLGEI